MNGNGNHPAGQPGEALRQVREKLGMEPREDEVNPERLIKLQDEHINHLQQAYDELRKRVKRLERDNEQLQQAVVDAAANTQ